MQILRLFDQLEDGVRARLSRHPIIYAILGGIGVVLFWRGVWETADVLSKVHPILAWFFYPPVQIVVSALGLMLIGLMVSVFIGHRILLSGLKNEKKLEEQTEKLVEAEVITLTHLRDEIRALKNEIESLKK
jgi:hypothetical protein